MNSLRPPPPPFVPQLGAAFWVCLVEGFGVVGGRDGGQHLVGLLRPLYVDPDPGPIEGLSSTWTNDGDPRVYLWVTAYGTPLVRTWLFSGWHQLAEQINLFWQRLTTPRDVWAM